MVGGGVFVKQNDDGCARDLPGAGRRLGRRIGNAVEREGAPPQTRLRAPLP